MSTHTPKSADDQEIDLGAISKSIGRAVDGFARFIYRSTRFFIKNIVVISILIIAGAVLGYFMDKGKFYDHEIVVNPNFGSTDYLYAKIELLDAKIQEKDTVFLKSLGIKNPKKFLEIKIKPIVDIYRFVNTNELNFRVLELLADDGDLNKIVEEPTTSKNYNYHVISIVTKGRISHANLVQPLMDYFNNSAFYSQIQQKYIQNVKSKMITNDTLIAQIDAVLESIAKTGSTGSSGTTVYNSQGSQLNDVIRTKDEFIEEQAQLRIDMVSIDKIVKENTAVLNKIRVTGMAGKMKIILPVVFLLLFIIIYNMVRFYKKQAQRDIA